MPCVRVPVPVLPGDLDVPESVALIKGKRLFTDRVKPEILPVLSGRLNTSFFAAFQPSAQGIAMHPGNLRSGRVMSTLTECANNPRLSSWR